jgi:DNA repair protein RadC
MSINKQNKNFVASDITYPALSTSSLAIKHWRPDDKPRERLLRNGAASLSDAELLAILIKTGTEGVSALDVGRTLLHRFNTLTELASRDVGELRVFRGMGEVKAITLAAAFEIGKRIQTEPFSSKPAIRSPQDVANLFIPRMRGIRKEQFYVLLLNTANQIFRETLVSEGSLNASIVHPREVFRLAVIESAASIIVLHNHPSGNLEPSREDIEVTRQLVEAGTVLGIPVHDHIIIAGESFTSLRQLNKI